MEKILLVEPEYLNKYPPLGLMKIATYHKNKGDKVDFYKGKAPYTVISKMDRVYITTLFTFYYDITIETIKHYMNYLDSEKIFVGGIASTLLYDNFRNDTGLNNIITGQLTSSTMIGYLDDINIDELPLDYDILDDISYKYPAGDNFFVYTTRGCPRKCSFCAVATLEPKFKDTNQIIKQIEGIRAKYGDKRNVLIMDNNVLFSKKLKQIADDLVYLGFERNSANYVYPNPFELLVNKIGRRKEAGNNYIKQEEELNEFLTSFATRIASKSTLSLYQAIIDKIHNCNDKYQTILLHREELSEIIEKYRFKKPLQRFVDFNQGIDARLLDEEKMKFLQNLPIKPFRLAYDDVKETGIYYRAFSIAYKYGVRNFSNYILYNYKDEPKDLWDRLYNTIKMYKEGNDIKGFSFPMKYAPINETGRDFIGEKWNKKYLSAMNIILNVTNGVVAKEEDFFYKAYGNNPEEFMKILTMPNEFIKHRFYFEEKGYIYAWENQYNTLSSDEKICLLDILCGKQVPIEKTTKNVTEILKFYKITKFIASKTKDYFEYLNQLKTMQQ